MAAIFFGLKKKGKGVKNRRIVYEPGKEGCKGWQDVAS